MSNELTQERVKELFDYNQITGHLVWKVNKGAIKAGSNAGYEAKDRYYQVGIDRKLYRNHRVIYLFVYGYFPARIDHLDGDGLNNRIGNLRPCTSSQNNCNARLSKDNTSGVKGVSWYSRTKKWRASVSHKMKRYELGYFDEILSAEEAVKTARKNLHGEFANYG